MRRYMTRAEEGEFLRSRLRDLDRSWRVGDQCQTYRGDGTTTVACLDGEIATLANGDQCHVSKLRSA